MRKLSFTVDPRFGRRTSLLGSWLLSTALYGACDDAVRPDERDHWGVEATARGFVAAADDWVVVGGGGDLDAGAVPGINVYYRGEPVGGGGIYDFSAAGRVWNEWVPFLVPTNPGYSELRSFRTRGDTLVLAFADSLPVASTTQSSADASETFLQLDARIILNRDTLEFRLGGMHMVFFPMRTGEAYTISCRSVSAAQDTTLVIGHASPDQALVFAGPSDCRLRSAHFAVDFTTDAPLMKLGIGREGVGSGGLVKFDLDHSLRAVPPRYYVNSRMTVTPEY